METRSITIQLDDPTCAGVRRLIAELDEYQAQLYPAESNHLVPVEALLARNVTFLTAKVDGELAGCGAFVDQGGAYAEIKRMFVSPRFRGLRLGEQMLARLESIAVASGLPVARLETGIHQAAALGLYAKAGYAGCGPFGDYGEDPLSVFMEKALTK